MPNDGDPSGTTAVEALVSGPRMAAQVRPPSSQKTNSQVDVATDVICDTPVATLRHTRWM